VPLLPTPIADDQRYNPVVPLTHAVACLDLMQTTEETEVEESTNQTNASTATTSSTGLGIEVPPQKRTKTADEESVAPVNASVVPPQSVFSSGLSATFSLPTVPAKADKMEIEAPTTQRSAPPSAIKAKPSAAAAISAVTIDLTDGNDEIDVDAEPDSADDGNLSD